jgi:hypothetical protein
VLRNSVSANGSAGPTVWGSVKEESCYALVMAGAVENAVRTYIRAVGERDEEVRATLLEACIADEARMVTRSRVIAGRAALAEMVKRFVEDPELEAFALTSAIDLGATTFRYSSIVKLRSGRVLEFFDAGEIDAEGKISLLLVFDGPLDHLPG